MQNTGKSPISCSWEIAAFGAKQLTTLICSLMAAQARLSSPQRGLFRFTLAGLQKLADLIASILPDANQRARWQELRNKARVFELFANVKVVLGLARETCCSTSELIGKASGLEAFESVWAVEGVGHLLAERWTESSGPLFPEVPRRWLVPLHVGMGLSFANRTLKSLSARPTEPEARLALERFTHLCRSASHGGFELVSYEALGLVTRTLYPHLVRLVARQAAQIKPELEELFWHGVGRGLYFLMANALPSRCAPWAALQEIQREPPHVAARRNTLAGFVWALTLVNLPQPEILALFLKHHRGVLCEGDAFRNGLTSSILVWMECAPEDATAYRFIEHCPEPGDQDLCHLWTEEVTRPCSELLRIRRLRRDTHRCLPEVFRYYS
jgi:hypothetical protein